ncbi:MAG: universal stress protein [Coriobacteriia bacterium]
MFSRAVIATDLSPSSEGIVACASSLRALGVGDALLVHAIDLRRGPSAEEDASFARQAEALEAAGIAVHVETPLGYAPHAICSLAATREADLIVMGTHGAGLFHTGFSGSVSSDVVRLSPVPVLLAPASAASTEDEGRGACARLLSSVLVAIDIDAPMEPLEWLAKTVAMAPGARLDLLAVVPLTFEAVREGRESRAGHLLGELADDLRRAGAPDVAVSVHRGPPDEIIASYASSGRYTLLMLAPGCQDTIEKAFGSVTNAVIRRSAVPLLLAPPGCDITAHQRGNT